MSLLVQNTKESAGVSPRLIPLVVVVQNANKVACSTARVIPLIRSKKFEVVELSSTGVAPKNSVALIIGNESIFSFRKGRHLHIRAHLSIPAQDWAQNCVAFIVINPESVGNDRLPDALRSAVIVATRIRNIQVDKKNKFVPTFKKRAA